MSDEELFRGFRERWPHPSPMWNMLWSPVGFFSDSTFEENIERLLPSGDIRDRVKEFFEGKRWHISELSEECREKFEFFMLDYRSGACFMHSRQVDDYALRVLNINLRKKMPERDNSVLMNDTLFEWSDTIEKAREFVNEEIPTGADMVMYLLFKCSTDHEFICEPDPINVYFHGEDVEYYRHFNYIMMYHYHLGQDEEIPLLVALSMEGNLGFLAHKWTTYSIEGAIEYVESELSCMRDILLVASDDEYIEAISEDLSLLEKSLNALKSLDDSWSVSGMRIGISNNSYPKDDELIKEIEYMEKSIRKKCKCGRDSANDCEWKKCKECCQGCHRHKKKKPSRKKKDNK